MCGQRYAHCSSQGGQGTPQSSGHSLWAHFSAQGSKQGGQRELSPHRCWPLHLWLQTKAFLHGSEHVLCAIGLPSPWTGSQSLQVPRHLWPHGRSEEHGIAQSASSMFSSQDTVSQWMGALRHISTVFFTFSLQLDPHSSRWWQRWTHLWPQGKPLSHCTVHSRVEMSM